jgi:DNA repair protein RadC
MFTMHIQCQTLKEARATCCSTPEAAADELADLRHADRELFVVLTLNTKNYLIDRHLVSVGTLNATLVHPREVFRPAIADGAAGVIIAHNHPSGNPAPSPEDIKITRQLIEAGRLLNLPVLDHLIIGSRDGRPDFVSLRESGMAAF